MSGLAVSAKNLMTLANNFSGINAGVGMIVVSATANLRQSARDEFRQALVKGVTGQLFRKRSILLVFDDILNAVHYNNRHEVGVVSIPVDQIIGSLGRGHDFDIKFYPLSEHLERRWASVWSARMKGLSLEPVSLYKIGEVYFVEDGHHRISVARSFGQQDIEAQVIELHVDDVRSSAAWDIITSGLWQSLVELPA